METNERIIEFINCKGLSINAFEKSIGKSTNYIRNSKSFTSNVLATIMEVYPEINIEWLISGKGKMIKEILPEQFPVVLSTMGFNSSEPDVSSESLLQRIKDLISITGESERGFAKLIGVNPKTLNQQIRGDRALSLETITKIISSIEDISVDWLMTGRGEAIISHQQTENKRENHLEKLIQGLQEKYGISKEEIIERTCIDPFYFHGIVSGITPMGDTVVNKLIETFPEINRQYLETGNGEMFIENTTIGYQSNKELLEVIKEQSVRIDKLLKLLESK